MIRFLPLIAVILSALSISAVPAPTPPVPAIVPVPAEASYSKGAFHLPHGARVRSSADDPEVRRIAAYFVSLTNKTSGLALEAASAGAKDAAIDFVLDPKSGLSSESYRLVVTAKGARVEAGAPQGLFYGATTLWQLATPAGDAKSIPAMTILDHPRFEWRGLMLDSARHYQSPEFVKEFIDWMALHKLNVLHWHLTDDQAWRLEIKRYPKLTEVGAYRVPAGEGAAANIDPKTGKPKLYGGYYTQAEVKDIVRYAAERFVTIVPEIEMPGHAEAPIVAYPNLGVLKHPPKTVSSDWGVFPYLYGPDETTFAFLENVLDEVMALFPSAYIHVGGDEAVKEQWERSKDVQKLMQALGIKSEDALQGYFTKRIGDYLAAHGRRLIGWDDILGAGVPKDAVVMSWRGAAGAVAAAKEGHDVTLAVSPDLYFDHRQSDAAFEPPGRGDVISLKTVYDFNVTPDALSQGDADHVLGVEANVWTEHIRTERRVEYMTWPRAAAVAELAWSPEKTRDWRGFLARLAPMLARYRALGIDYADSAFAPYFDATEEDGGAVVALSSQSDFGAIRYALGGVEPTAKSPAYSKPLRLAEPSTLRAAAFDGDERLSRIVEKTFDHAAFLERSSQQLKTCSNKLVLNLEDDAPVDGPRAVFLVDIMNPCWIFEGADLDGVDAIEASVGEAPFNFQIGDDIKKIKLEKPLTKAGELNVRLDSCDDAVIARLPLAPAKGNFGIAVLRGALPKVSGKHDLCFTFASKNLDPMHVIDKVRLVTAASAAP